MPKTLFERMSDAARRPYNPEPELPEGLVMLGGRVQFACRVCGSWTEWPAEVADFDIGAAESVCGDSPRCCP